MHPFICLGLILYLTSTASLVLVLQLAPADRLNAEALLTYDAVALLEPSSINSYPAGFIS